MPADTIFFNQLLLKSLTNLVGWIEKNKGTSYDQYDFWSTKYGKYSKRIYYTNKIFGSLLVVPIFIIEILIPSSRKIFVKRKRFPIADAHLIMGYINLYNSTKKESYLQKAEEIGDILLNSSIKGFSGYCWGYPFDWMTNRGLWKRNTPLITTTPYCFEAYLALYDSTANEKYLKIARSIFDFAMNDIYNNVINDNEIASSYSTVDKSKVVNASAYRAFILAESSERFNNEEAKVLANKLVNFILDKQNDNGSWLYAIENPQDAFIDNFHTCFVLKNLFKSNLVLRRKEIDESIIKGYIFYKNHLLTKDFRPIPFSYVSRFNIVKEETYDYAEGILLGILLQEMIPESLDISVIMAGNLITNYQTISGYFITRIMLFNFKNKVPYMRWPQSQIFFALSTLIKSRG
jgi:hypothetical protein